MCAGTVSGSVLDFAGQPVAGAAVHIDQFVLGGENGPWNTVTDANGNFSVSDILLFGNVRVTATKPGQATNPGFRDLFFDVTDTASFVMGPPGIVGVVKDAAGVPASGVEVTARLVTGDGPAFVSSNTDAAGRYALIAATAMSGAYEIRARHTALLLPVQMATVNSTATTQKVLNIQATAPYTQVRDLPETERENGVWGDYDNDGRPDLLLFGDGLANTARARLLHQNSSASSLGFESAYIPNGVRLGDACWRDFDNDGDLDFALAGVGSLQIYAQQNGTFAMAADLPGLISVELITGDINNDGREDFVLSGINPVDSNAATRVLINRGGMVFESIPLPLGLDPLNSAGALVDFDNDGDLDLALSGFGGAVDVGLHLRLYQQHQQLTSALLFTRFRATSDQGQLLPAAEASHWVWADADGDGRLDMAYGSNGRTTWARQVLPDPFGGPLFGSVQSISRSDEPSSLAWGDLNADGYPELIECSRLRTHQVVNGILGAVAGGGGLNSTHRYASIVDVDGDKRLDVALIGDTLVRSIPGKLLSSPGTPANARPSAPRGLTVGAHGNMVRLGWEAASDDTTPQAALSYNIRAGTVPGGVNLVSPEADAASGRRWIYERGCANATHWMLRGLPRGVKIYWAVQAIDAGCEGGPWSEEHSFVMPEIESITAQPDGTMLLHITGGFVPAIEASHDLINWSGINVLPHSIGADTSNVLDPLAGLFTRRFYRPSIQ